MLQLLDQPPTQLLGGNGLRPGQLPFQAPQLHF